MYSKFLLTYRGHREVTLPTIHFIEIMADRPTDATDQHIKKTTDGHEGTKKSFAFNKPPLFTK